MKNTTICLLFAKVKSNIPQIIGLVFLILIGVSFYITLFSIVDRYEETAEQYFNDHSYADLTLYGLFNKESIDQLMELDGIKLAQGRFVYDYRENERVYRAISLTNIINTPYIYEGRFPSNDTEILILKRSATAMSLALDDTIIIDGKQLTITGLVASPEYIYLVQNERNMMASANTFAVIYVYETFFQSNYNEIVILTEPDYIEITKEIVEFPGVIRSISRNEQINHDLYRDDMGQIRSFAVIFPLVFAILISIVIYVMLSRMIQKDRKEIGIMKALGVSHSKIITIYLTQFTIAALVGAVLGGIGSVFLCDIIIDILSSMFEVPTLGYAFYPTYWFVAICISLIICVTSGLIALVSILPLLPAIALRPKVPKNNGRILLERISFIWQQLSFNTRYSLKTSLRNKSRFFAIVLGMCGSCALLVFSLGFNDSVFDTQDKYFKNFANFDVAISFDPIARTMSHPALDYFDEFDKVLATPVEMFGSRYILFVVESDFDMLYIPHEALDKGIVIPEYFASEWQVAVGDIVRINDIDVVISAIMPQYLGLRLITGVDYIYNYSDAFALFYNTIYGRSNDLVSLSNQLSNNKIEFSTIDDDRTSFDSVLMSTSVLIWFMIFCAVVLGFTVLYSVGLINLSAREYEYMFMGVMGYPLSKILLAHIKETILQLIIAIPIGFILSNILLESIKYEFSSDNFVISSAIFPKSYMLSTIILITVTIFMVFVTSQHIKKLDIVECLKGQDA